MARPDGAQVLGAARALAETFGMVRPEWNGFNVLHRAAARVGGLDLGFLPGPGGQDVAGILAGCRSGAIEILYLLGADELDLSNTGAAFVIYQGHHGDRGAARADVVLPGCRLYRKGRDLRQYRRPRAARPPRRLSARRGARGLGDPARAVWRAGPAAAVRFARELREQMRAAHPVFARIDEIVAGGMGPFRRERAARSGAVRYPIADFYRTDPISRASPTMAECSQLFAGDPEPQPRTGTHG